MSTSTNSLVAKAKRLGLPAGIAATVVLGLTLMVGHKPAFAASNGAAAADTQNNSALISLDDAVEALAARVTPAVVNVSVTSRITGDDSESDDEQGSNNGPQNGQNGVPPEFRWFFGNGFGQGFGQGQGTNPSPQIERGIGSGVIISPDGYILTNDHVVNGAMQIRVTMHDRRVFPAKLVGVDKLNDLAVIKIDANNLPTVPWGNSTELHPGQTVLAFGSPFGYFQFSVTRGIISALNRPNPYSNNARKPGDFIQTDAAINPGNSGGPLVDARGQLIGINTFIITDNGSFAGAGFAIPSQIAEASANSIIKTGHVEHGYLGISMNDVTPENASFFDLHDASGAIVSQVVPDSPAAAAGVKSGDVLRELNGKKIVNGSALQVAVEQIAPGNSISLGILRDGKPMTLDIKVGQFHAKNEVAANNAGGNTHGKLGLTVDNLTPDVRSQLNVPSDVNGAAVESVRPASPADDAGLAPGDVILQVDHKPVTSAENFVSQIHAVPPDKDILVLVWSKGGTFFRVLHPQETNPQNGME
ncbi:MAG TPA: Do family serine endopeptidase [Terracidiphilus sp.]|nr:Do family serine endopeptidase [Terracidiphilus sp.]